MKFFTLALLVLPFLVMAGQVDAQQKRLEAGDNIPTKVMLLNQHNEKTMLQDTFGEEGGVIVFYRSAEWCPYCQAQLINLKAHQEDIEAVGYNLIGISYDDVEDLKAFSDKRKISYPLLSDKGSETIKAFGIFNEEHKEGNFAYGVPHPAIYIVNSDGSIKGVLLEDGYKKRPEVSDIFEAIEK
jgi:peroxiredoxin